MIESKSNTTAVVSAAADQVQMAVERTYLAYERTLLAWVRTGTSLVTFGLTLFKFVEFLHEQNPELRPSRFLSARTVGLIMVMIGVTTLAAACWQHRQRMRRLQIQDESLSFSPAYVLATLMSLLGVLALISPLLNH